MAYGDFKDLTRTKASEKILRDKVFNSAKNPKYDEYQKVMTSMVHNIFDKKLLIVVLKMRVCQIRKLAQELHKLIIRKFKKGKVHSTFIDNIWSADLADMQLISKFNKGFRFLLCVIYIFSKYAWVIPLKDKKCITVTNAFQKTFKISYRKPR